MTAYLCPPSSLCTISLGVPQGRRIGLLGGSFNPAHAGHLHISLEALKRLKLDEIWWLVSPGNPLKPEAGMAPLEHRLISARQMARHPRIRVSDLEASWGLRYTADTLTALRRRWSRTSFVWLMGADNLAQIHRWHNWTTVFETVTVAILARPTYALSALSSPAAQRFAKARLSAAKAATLARHKPPAWVYVAIPLHPESATRIRAAKMKPSRQAEETKP